MNRKIRTTILVLITIFLLFNCGSFTYQYEYSDKYKNVLNEQISSKPRIAILVTEVEVQKKVYNNIFAFHKRFNKYGYPIEIATEKSDKGKFDLLITQYETIKDDPQIIPTITFIANILTLGIIPFYSPTDYHTTITTLRPRDSKISTIKFTEHYKQQDGWIPWIIGKNTGTYVSDYDRYYYDQEPSKLHPVNELKMLIFEAANSN
ncbi:MAG: hypothetical protein O9275_07050 [Microcystis sp. LE19-196.1B]|nr:hypothetical protein [Microcystis sp. LE19-196.1B]